MITRRYENPFHTIVFDYDEQREETAYEKELVRRYLHFLNQQVIKRNLITVLTSRYQYERKLAAEALTFLKEFEKEQKSISEIAEQFKKEKFIIPGAFASLRKQMEESVEKYFRYHEDKVSPIRDEMNANEEKFDELFKWFEDEQDGEAFSHFDDYAKELYDHYDNYSLDLVRFDNDVEEMKSEWQKLSNEWDKLFQFREETVKHTSAFSDKIAVVNKASETMQKTLIDMEFGFNAWNN